MSARLKKRVESKANGPEVLHVDFPEAGHGFLIPFQSDEQKTKILSQINNMLGHLGGTAAGFEEAMTKSLESALSELEKIK